MINDRPPVKFQHLELTFPIGSLTKELCQEIDSFWCGVFGWRSDDVVYPDLDNMFQHRIHADGQTLVLAESDEPMSLPTKSPGNGPDETLVVPHLGVELANMEELERLLAASTAFQEQDPRVKIWDSGENRFPGHPGVHHAFLVAFLLPVWFDVYATRWDPGAEPKREWRLVDASASVGTTSA